MIYVNVNRVIIVIAPYKMLCNLTIMKELAHSLAKNTKSGDVILLDGDLGVGKTTFAKFFIHYFCPEANISSPTFSIVNVYLPNNQALSAIWHFDLYRIQDAKELYEIGIEEALSSGISIIEWPKIAESFMPKETTVVSIKFANNIDYRIVNIA